MLLGWLRSTHVPNLTAPTQEKGRLQMAVKSEQQRRVKAEGELRRAQVRCERGLKSGMLLLRRPAGMSCYFLAAC